MSDWSGNKKAVFVTNGDSNHSQQARADWDYYATDPRAVEELLKREQFCLYIYEPACGGGHISEELKKHGYKVESADIVNRGYKDQTKTADFLQDYEQWLGDIVTNPPYKYAAEFVEHALRIIGDGQKVAMFLKLTFLEGEKRRALFQQHPPCRIYVFTNRINCALNGEQKYFNASSAVCYAWFVWEKGSQQKPVIDWI